MKNIVLCGFMGAGKTAVGSALAKMLGRPFVDTDSVIEAEEGITVSEIFRRLGERRFRKTEAKVVKALSGTGGLVISAGGGALLDKKNAANLARNGVIVRLDASPDAIARRIGKAGTRPLLAGKHGELKARISDMLEKRRKSYSIADFAVDTTHLDAATAAKAVAAVVAGGARKGKTPNSI